MRTFIVVACLLVGTAPSPALMASPGDILVAGANAEESLTQAKQRRLIDFIEWVFKAPLTARQRTRLSDQILKEWRNPEEREGLREWLGAADQVDALPEAQRSLVREQLLEVVVPELRNQATTDADARWLLGIFDAANRPLVPGNPALTRQASDATLEMLYFIMGKAHGLDVVPTQAELDGMAKELTTAWPKLAAERRKEIASTPMQWATLRAAWDVASAADRAGVAQGWRSAFPLPQAQGGSTVMRDAAAKVEELNALLTHSQALTPERMMREADAVAALIARLEREPGTEPRALATQMKTLENALRNASAGGRQAIQPATQAQGSAVPAKPNTAADFARQTQALMFSQQMHQQNMAMMEQMRMSRFNMIQNLGNSSYRYTNSFGNPY